MKSEASYHPSDSASDLVVDSPYEDREYASLLRREVSNDSDVKQKGPNERYSKLDLLGRTATLVVVLCTVLDLILVLYLGLHQHGLVTPTPPSVVSDEDLEVQMPYINLAQLYAEKPHLKTNIGPIVTHSRAFVQIDQAYPDKVSPPYAPLRPLSEGLVPEYDRRLILTDTISTVAQFRVADLGMESCALRVTILEDSKDILIGPGEPAAIDVYKLPVLKKIKMHHLSYATRPEGATFFGTMTLAFNSSFELPAYPCKAGTHETFEFRCSQPGCKVEVTGMGGKALGLYMVQYQTI
uniref:Ubiquitin 3 binding protein But2 C-terminal domain-containing protein n=1 Tax=Mycena chlorophos TaxID=658473 RepID=A0ABQ0LP58_MYCCL|nr:predicted protein [Mycena chlorophos]